MSLCLLTCFTKSLNVTLDNTLSISSEKTCNELRFALLLRRKCIPGGIQGIKCLGGQQVNPLTCGILGRFSLTGGGTTS